MLNTLLVSESQSITTRSKTRLISESQIITTHSKTRLILPLADGKMVDVYTYTQVYGSLLANYFRIGICTGFE